MKNKDIMGILLYTIIKKVVLLKVFSNERSWSKEKTILSEKLQSLRKIVLLKVFLMGEAEAKKNILSKKLDLKLF